MLFLDHEDVLEATRELADADRLKRPGHADLVDADAQLAAGGGVDPEVFQRLKHVQVGLAGGGDAQPRVGRIEHHPVDAVGARERLRGLDRVHVQAHFLVERRIGPADVEAVGRHLEIVRGHDLQRERIHVDRRRRLHRLGDRLEPDPAPGEPRHRPAQHPHVEDVLHAGRIEHRHHRADEFLFGAVRQRRRTTGVVVGRQRQHATVLRCARGVAVLEHVAAAIHARPLAVPHRIHAIDGRAGEQVGLLRAPDHGRAQVLVEAGLELHPGRLQVLARAPQLQVEAAQRRAAIAGDEAAGVEPRRLVAQPLHQRQPHQRLHAGQVDAPGLAAVLVIQAVVRIGQAIGEGRAGRGRGAEFGGTGHDGDSMRGALGKRDPGARETARHGHASTRKKRRDCTSGALAGRQDHACLTRRFQPVIPAKASMTGQRKTCLLYRAAI